MTEDLQLFLAQRLPLPGIAAWALRLADRTVASQCFENWFTRPQVEEVLTRITLAADNIEGHPYGLSWTFERARILLARRGDGACLALFVENRSNLDTAPLQELLNEFRNLPGA
jgi:hypothetical protein